MGFKRRINAAPISFYIHYLSLNWKRNGWYREDIIMQMNAGKNIYDSSPAENRGENGKSSEIYFK